MGANNLKYENEYMSIPNFIPGISPVKTEADPTLMTGIASQLERAAFIWPHSLSF
jgi:hypothetical protein